MRWLEVSWVIIDQLTNYEMYTRSQLLTAFKVGAWTEFAAERAYNSNQAKKWRMRLSQALKRRPRRPIYAGRRRLAGTPKRKRWHVKYSYRARMAYFKRKGMFSPKSFGLPVNTSNSKNVVTEKSELLNTRQLYVEVLTRVDRGTGISERERDIINARGFDLCGTIVSTNSIPLVFNIALLVPKQQSGVSGTNFFRNISSQNFRDENFSTARSQVELHCLPINSDNYLILYHMRGSVNGTRVSNDPNSGAESSYKMVRRYKPIKRQIPYSGESGLACDSPVFMVYWCDQVGADSLSPSLPSVCKFQWRHAFYFREPKN